MKKTIIVLVLVLIAPVLLAQQGFRVEQRVDGGATATYTENFYMRDHTRLRLDIAIEDDGDGGDFTYTVKRCPLLADFGCMDFSPAMTGTLTVGGTTQADVWLDEPVARVQVAITGNDALVNLGAEYHP